MCNSSSSSYRRLSTFPRKSKSDIEWTCFYVVDHFYRNLIVLSFPQHRSSPVPTHTIQFSEDSPSSFSFVKLSSPVHVHSGARSKTPLRFPSKWYLMKTGSLSEFNISVDSSNCKAYFPFLTLSTSWHFISWAMMVMRRAIVPLDSTTDYDMLICVMFYVSENK